MRMKLGSARRKPRSANFPARKTGQEMSDEGLGEPPKPARQRRALPIPISEFGLVTSAVTKYQKNILVGIQTRCYHQCTNPIKCLSVLAAKNL